MRTSENFTPLPLPGVYLHQPMRHMDERGYFYEAFNTTTWQGVHPQQRPFVQQNVSRSARGVFRGLHLQREPYAQAKLVRVVSGSIIDIIADVRSGSPTFAKWISVKLDSKEGLSLYVPAGYAHGFVALEEATVEYLVDEFYTPHAEICIYHGDQQLALDITAVSGINPLIVSEKDRQGLSLAEYATL